MPFRIAMLALCLVLLPGERANAQDAPRLTKEDCAQLEATFHDRPHRPEERGFYMSDEYRRCSEAAFALEPNAGLEILNALTGEGESHDRSNDIRRLEKRLFFATVNGTKNMPQYVQCCYEIVNERRCVGIFADDSEHFDALIFKPFPLKAGKAEPVVLQSDKPNYVLQSLFFNGQAVPFSPAGQAAWKAVLPADSKTRHDVHVLNAIFAWNGNGSQNSQEGPLRKVVWYYTNSTPSKSNAPSLEGGTD